MLEWKFGGERAFNEFKRAAASLFNVTDMTLEDKPYGSDADFSITAPLNQQQWNEIFSKIDVQRYRTKLTGNTMEFFFGVRRDDSQGDLVASTTGKDMNI